MWFGERVFSRIYLPEISELLLTCSHSSSIYVNDYHYYFCSQSNVPYICWWWWWWVDRSCVFMWRLRHQNRIESVEVSSDKKRLLSVSTSRRKLWGMFAEVECSSGLSWSGNVELNWNASFHDGTRTGITTIKSVWFLVCGRKYDRGVKKRRRK